VVPTNPSALALRPFALLALCVLSTPSFAQRPPAAVRVDAVREELVTNRRPVTGNLRAARRSQVAAREKGLVMARAVDEGTQVKAGDLLAQLDATQLELDLEVLVAQRPPAEATVLEREAEVRQRQNDLDSLEQLIERKAANPKELVDAEATLSGAAARLKVAKALVLVIDSRIKKLEKRISDMTITAPFAGTVTQALAEVGSWLGEGEAVVELLSTQDLEVWLEVPQDLYGAAVRNKGPIEVKVGASGESFAMIQARVIPDVDLRGRSFRLIGRAADTLPLAAGMSVTAMMPTEEERNVLTVHRDAILRNQVSAFVYAVIPGAEGAPPSAAPIDVTLLFQTADRAVVRSSRLRAGMEVVIEGNERLYPMAPIAPLGAGAPPKGGGPAPGGQDEGGAPAGKGAPSGEPGATPPAGGDKGEPESKGDAQPGGAPAKDARSPGAGGGGQASRATTGESLPRVSANADGDAIAVEVSSR